MEIGTLIRELGGGMWVSAEIFILTLHFFTAAWTGGCIRENVEDCTGQMDIKIIHIDYERNPADASVDGSVFRTILSVWNAHFHRIPYDCGADRFCN